MIASKPGVFWRHEDVVTGSYSKIGASGSYGGHADDSPTAVEYEPLGGAIPTTDPNYNLIPAGLTQFKFAGDVYRPEYGCNLDGTPIRCDLIGPALRASSGTSEIHVNVRAEGGYALYSSLSSLVSTWRYNVREVVNDENGRLQREHYSDTANWHGNKYHLFVGSFYVQYLSDFAETIIGGQDYNVRRFLNLPKDPDPPPARPPSMEDAVLDLAEAVLNDSSDACTRALSNAGLLTSMKKKLRASLFLSVVGSGDKSAGTYFSSAAKGETVQMFFARMRPTRDGAYAAEKAILTMNGASDFLVGSYTSWSNSHMTGFFLHELTHHATGYTDVQLVARLRLRSGRGEDASDTVSRYFNSGCDEALVRTVSPRTRRKR